MQIDSRRKGEGEAIWAWNARSSKVDAAERMGGRRVGETNLGAQKKRKGIDAKTGIWNLQPLAKEFLYSTLQKVEWKYEQNLSSCSMRGNCLRGGCRNALSLWGPRRRHLSCDSPPLQTNVFAACHREMKRYSSEGGK